jgi:hypothetical protein
MELPIPRSIAMEAVISLQHIFRVARAVNIDPLTGVECAVAYVVEETDLNIVAETWKRAFEEAPELAVVLVDGLPRGAKVEWHLIRCQKSSDEAGEARFRMLFEEHRVPSTISDIRGELGLLCMIFGSHEINTSTYTNIAIQTIPSRAVYSVNNGIKRHKSCTIILAE